MWLCLSDFFGSEASANWRGRIGASAALWAWSQLYTFIAPWESRPSMPRSACGQCHLVVQCHNLHLTLGTSWGFWTLWFCDVLGRWSLVACDFLARSGIFSCFCLQRCRHSSKPQNMHSAPMVFGRDVCWQGKDMKPAQDFTVCTITSGTMHRGWSRALSFCARCHVQVRKQGGSGDRFCCVKNMLHDTSTCMKCSGFAWYMLFKLITAVCSLFWRLRRSAFPFFGPDKHMTCKQGYASDSPIACVQNHFRTIACVFSHCPEPVAKLGDSLLNLKLGPYKFKWFSSMAWNSWGFGVILQGV